RPLRKSLRKGSVVPLRRRGEENSLVNGATIINLSEWSGRNQQSRPFSRLLCSGHFSQLLPGVSTRLRSRIDLRRDTPFESIRATLTAASSRYLKMLYRFAFL